MLGRRKGERRSRRQLSWRPCSAYWRHRMPAVHCQRGMVPLRRATYQPCQSIRLAELQGHVATPAEECVRLSPALSRSEAITVIAPLVAVLRLAADEWALEILRSLRLKRYCWTCSAGSMTTACCPGGASDLR